jgi:hypothetical protein
MFKKKDKESVPVTDLTVEMTKRYVKTVALNGYNGCIVDILAFAVNNSSILSSEQLTAIRDAVEYVRLNDRPVA